MTSVMKAFSYVIKLKNKRDRGDGDNWNMA